MSDSRQDEGGAIQPVVGEADRRWIEGMRLGDQMRRRMLSRERNDPIRNVLAYEGLMDMVLKIHGRVDINGKPYEEAEIRLANTLAGRKVDTSCLPDA